MTRKEQLYERYEDALFALLMDEVARSEGEKAAEESARLNADPSAAVPEEVDRRSLRTIRRRFARQKARSAGRITARAFGRVAMVAGVAVMLFTAAFAASDTVRVNTLNLLIETFDYGTVFSFQESKTAQAPQFELGWVPDGFALTERTESEFYTRESYAKSETEYFEIVCGYGNGSAVNIDTEGAGTESVEINGLTATFVQEEDDMQIIMVLPGNTTYVHIWGIGMVQDDVIKLAEGIIL